ncbi:hypothetical protein HDU88_002013 [Geranomyces variabilis]|nr:hypothetical protein HDU88_002013 [Geranomyces variabilis]
MDQLNIPETQQTDLRAAEQASAESETAQEGGLHAIRERVQTTAGSQTHQEENARTAAAERENEAEHAEHGFSKPLPVSDETSVPPHESAILENATRTANATGSDETSLPPHEAATLRGAPRRPNTGQMPDLYVVNTEEGELIMQGDDAPQPRPENDSEDEERPLFALLDDDEERPLVALLDDEELPLVALLDDEELPLVALLDEEEVPLAALLDEQPPHDIHPNHPDQSSARPESLLSGSSWTKCGSDLFDGALDPNLRATFDALFQARVAPLINHMHRLEAQVSHLTLAVSRMEGFLKAQGPQVQLGPGKFLAAQQDPAEELHRRMDKVINAVGMTNPGAIARKAELGAGLLADMPVRMNYLSNGDLAGAAGSRDASAKPGAGSSSGGGTGAVLIKSGNPNGPPATYTLATERVECLQCKGRGWEHTNVKEKHKAASPDSRCKKCSDCGACGGSGMRDGYTCRDCDASGQREEGGVLTKCTTCNGEGITDTPPRAADISSTTKRRVNLNENKRKTMLLGLVPTEIVGLAPGSNDAGFNHDYQHAETAERPEDAALEELAQSTAADVRVAEEQQDIEGKQYVVLNIPDDAQQQESIPVGGDDDDDRPLG